MVAVTRVGLLSTLLLCGAEGVAAFSPTQQTSSLHTQDAPSSLTWAHPLFQRHHDRSRLCQVSIVEDTQQNFSADSHENPNNDCNGDADINNNNNEIEITDLSSIVNPVAGGEERSNQRHRANRHNAAMADTSFLRKRTATLLKATSPENSTKEIQALGGSMKIDKKTFHFLLDAWAFSGEPDAVQQATRLVDRMEDLTSRSSNICPDVRSYTKLINAISRSGDHDAGDQAEAVLQKMETLERTGTNLSAKPNSFTYTAIVEAYANSGAPGSADKTAQLCERMVQQYEYGDTEVMPTARAFQAALVACAKSGEIGSAVRAEELVYRMEELYDSGIEELKPTAVNLNTLISVWANCGEEGSAQRAEEVLRRMEYQYLAGDEDLKPTKVSFNAVIDAYAKSGEEGAARKAEHVLEYMQILYESGENMDAKPNVRSFNSVINAWAKSRDPDSALHAHDILDRMERMYEEGNVAVRPDVHSFSTVINAWARSTAPDKADRALNLFREMKSLYEAGNTRLRPTVVSYNAVMNACAYTSNDNLHQQNRAMEIADLMFREINDSEFASPDQVTYGTFLKVCANQLPECNSRRQIVDSIFKNCRRDGQVGSLVIQQLKAVADTDQFEELLGRSIFDDIQMEDLPNEWWCNVVEGRWRRRKNQSQS